ncbi:MAG: iron-containing alcohol dehydrogenase [Halobacteriales archaeon]|nr:iron-containing alcohol dehydrogenase [Halobacteriales archaeon]
MPQDSHMWHVPNRMLFGPGTASEVGEYVGRFDAEHAFVVTDDGVREAGALDGMLDSITTAGHEYTVYDDVSPDPTDGLVADIATTYAAAGADLLIGAGGGSSIDATKGASILATNGGDIEAYFGSGHVEQPTPPTIYVPTTAGTGSEVGNWCIITDTTTDRKMEVGDIELLADLAVVDPDLIKSVPRDIAAATGMDVLAHAVEAYVSIRAQPHTSALALDAVERVGTYLPRVAEYRGDDATARSAMAQASTQAGMAFNGAGLGAVHALSHQIGGLAGVPHGLANAILLPYVIEYNRAQAAERFVDIAAALGEPVERTVRPRHEAYKAARAVRQLASTVRIPRTLEPTAIDRDRIPTIAERALDDGSITGNPRRTTADDLESILEKAFDGTFDYEKVL